MNVRLTRNGLLAGPISASPEVLFAGALLLYLGTDPVLTACLAAAAVHESSHLFACRILGGRVLHLRLTLLGAVLETDSRCRSGVEELLVALAGPLVNLASVPVSLGISHSEGTALFAGASLLLGLFNLLPVAPLDGSRAVHGLCSVRGPLERADELTHRISFVGRCILAVPAAVLAVLGNWSLLLVTAWMALQQR